MEEGAGRGGGRGGGGGWWTRGGGGPGPPRARPGGRRGAPGGGGKIPLLPEYVISMSDDEVVLRNFRGERYVYRQPQEDLALSRKRAARPRRKTA